MLPPAPTPSEAEPARRHNCRRDRPARAARLARIRPRPRGFLGDAEIEADLLDGGDVTVFRHALDAQHAAEMGYRADDEADAGAAAAFEHADLHAIRLLCVGMSRQAKVAAIAARTK